MVLAREAQPESDRSCGEEATCSAGPAAAGDPTDALQRAYAPHRRMFQRAVAVARDPRLSFFKASCLTSQVSA